MNKSAFKKWLMYVAIIIICTAVGGDFGLLAGLALIFMLQS